MSQKSPQGLVFTKSPERLEFIYLEPGPDVTEAVVNDWFGDAKSAIRYKAADSQTPTWLTLHNIETPEVANSVASDNGKAILGESGGLSRRTYTHLGTFTHPDTAFESLPCKYVLLVSLEMATPEAEDDLNKWYDEEHMDLLSKVSGWTQGRRYKLTDLSQKGLMADNAVAKYLAIHEFTENNFLGSPEFKHATSTEWRDRVMKNIVRREIRVFQLHKIL